MKNTTPRMKRLAYALVALCFPFLAAGNPLPRQTQAGCLGPDAGEDRIYCQLPDTISLTATPLGYGQTGSWSQVGGQVSNIVQPGSPSTLVDGLQASGGPYHFAWTVNSPDCTVADTVRIAERPAWAFRELQDLPCAETFNAGEDFLLETEPVTLEALDEFTVSLTFLAVPAGVRDIPVHPFYNRQHTRHVIKEKPTQSYLPV